MFKCFYINFGLHIFWYFNKSLPPLHRDRSELNLILKLIRNNVQSYYWTLEWCWQGGANWHLWHRNTHKCIGLSVCSRVSASCASAAMRRSALARSGPVRGSDSASATHAIAIHCPGAAPAAQHSVSVANRSTVFVWYKRFNLIITLQWTDNSSS